MVRCFLLDLPVSMKFPSSGTEAVCHTRDVSSHGCFCARYRVDASGKHRGVAMMIEKYDFVSEEKAASRG